MKLTSLFKKAATVLCALALVGMLAACSTASNSGANNGSGSGNGNSSGNGGGSGSSLTGDYKLMYDDILIADDWPEEYINYTKAILTVTTDYTMSGTTMTLTDAGFAKVLPAMGQSEGKTYVAIVVYQKRMIMPVTADEMTAAASKLTLGTDYTITHYGKVIELTATGYQNGAALFGGNGNSGNGNNNGSNEQTGEYKIMYDGIEIFWDMKESKFNKYKEVLSSSSYTISGKTMTLNDKGLDELLEFMSEDSEYTYVAIIVYMKKCVTGMPAEYLTQFKAVLTEGTDYTVTHNGKVYELTDSGMATLEASFGNNN